MYGIVHQLHFYLIGILKICFCKSGSVIAYNNKILEGRKKRSMGVKFWRKH